ncbi:MAG: hypothetical protein ACFFDI_16960 [Promethearchaeota archaeon]
MTINGETFYPDENGFMINFNITKTSSLVGQDLFLTMIISPDYEGLNGQTRLVIETSVVGMLKPLSKPFVNVLGAHPIPAIIMFPVLLASLFGIPDYFVYQEHVSDRDKNILDPQKQTKL